MPESCPSNTATEVRPDDPNTVTTDCPDWCRGGHHLTDFSTRVNDAGEVVLWVVHYGPTFGDWNCAAEENRATGTFWPDVALDRDPSPGAEMFDHANELRKMLADGQRALEWMESVAGD